MKSFHSWPEPEIGPEEIVEHYTRYAEIQGKADTEAVQAFADAVKQAGSSSKEGMWADSTLEDLVQYNDGFKTKLIGTKTQVAVRILLLKSLGIDVVVVGVSAQRG
ncbi:hypothetical protein B7494_g4348 [Chlorociboria aeruginascens]|nr:hypothetical protein B7494_g4348 [Chlorociboria aeruginascens]